MEKRLKIRDIREDNDITQRVVARYLRCDRAEYSKMENGRRPVPLWVVDKLADYYGTSVDYLIGRTDETEPYPEIK
jgi:transcriptional regulator with XRE-family HTH domain